MSIRTVRKTITFARPFSVSGVDEAQPPRIYVVDTEEELLPDLSFPAFRRRATLIWLRSRPGQPILEQAVEIDPLELQAAEERDALDGVDCAGTVSNELKKADDHEA
jgi:hypothetical protein